MPEQKAMTFTERQALQRFKVSLETLLADNLVMLRVFGSRARGEGTEESDLDVLVVLQEKDRTVCRRIVAEALEVDLVYGTNLAPTILTLAEYQQNQDYQTPFYVNVERESLLL